MRIHNEQIYLLAWVAGGLNALSFLGLGAVFSTNMTGNTVLLGIALARGDVEESLRAAVALVGFCIGVFVGGLCIEWQQKQPKWTPHRIVVLVLDAALLIMFTALWLAFGAQPLPEIKWLLLLCSTFAMGMQSALTLSLAFPGVATTYFTGTLTNLMAGIARLLHLNTGLSETEEEIEAEIKQEEHSLRRLAMMWVVYALASLVNSILFEHGPHVAIFLPTAAGILVVLDVLLSLALHRR